MNKTEVVQLIQLSLTPGIMISSSALFLLGLQNRFSSLFNRFRVLNQERRTLEQKATLDHTDSERLKNLSLQLHRLTKRVRAVKNAIIFFYLAIICFIGTSLLLFLFHSINVIPAEIGLAAFFTGMLSICIACFFMIREIILAFHILQLERRS